MRTRLGLDALAHVPSDAVQILRSWALSPPTHLAVAPGPIPEHAAFAHRSHALIAAAIEASTNGGTHRARPRGRSCDRVLQVVESALLVEETDLIDEHVQWLLDTGPAHGFERGYVNAALAALADAMNGELQRAGNALRAALS